MPDGVERQRVSRLLTDLPDGRRVRAGYAVQVRGERGRSATYVARGWLEELCRGALGEALNVELLSVGDDVGASILLVSLDGYDLAKRMWGDPRCMSGRPQTTRLVLGDFRDDEQQAGVLKHPRHGWALRGDQLVVKPHHNGQGWIDTADTPDIIVNGGWVVRFTRYSSAEQQLQDVSPHPNGVSFYINSDVIVDMRDR